MKSMMKDGMVACSMSEAMDENDRDFAVVVFHVMTRKEIKVLIRNVE